MKEDSVFRQLLKHPSSLFGLAIISVCVLLTLFSPFIRQDKSHDANEMNVLLAGRKPGFEVRQIKVKLNREAVNSNVLQQFITRGVESEYKLIACDTFFIKGVYLFFLEYSSPLETGYDSIALADVVYALKNNTSFTVKGNEVNLVQYNGSWISETIESLSTKVLNEHIQTTKFRLGTDKFGRDYLSRLIEGTYISLLVGAISVIISLLVGILLGSMAGFYRGWADSIIQWFVNVVWAVPTLLMVMAITLALGKGFWQIFLAVGLTMWVEVARVTRGQFLALREKEFVEAARALGYSDARIILKHILPNISGPLIVISASNFATAILIEAGLSFLGVGAQPPTPSWGSMIKEHYGYIILDKAYLAIYPGLAISLLVLAFVMLGNGLRDVLDTKSSRR
jgi:peptide/nickel transport system permease protein